MKRDDFVFAIGFDGNKAIVDKRSRSRFAKLDTRSLADEGLFRAAYRSAVYDSDRNAAEYVLEKFNLDSEKTIMIGDRKYDIVGARNNSINSIGVTYGHGDFKELEKAEASHIVDNCKELAIQIFKI